MKAGAVLAIGLAAATGALIAMGTIAPGSAALALAGAGSQVRPPVTPEAAATDVAEQISRHDFRGAWASMANKGQFSEPAFEHDLMGEHLSLRSYATLDGYDLRSLRASAADADLELRLRWSTVVGTTTDTRNLHLVKNGDRWQVDWPLVQEPTVPPQVIPVNYLRWDVIYRGAGDDWGAQDVEAPHIRIVDMRPVERADGVVVMGELLNEDVVPAYVTVKATLQAKDGHPLASAGSFDRISHVLLPKQVTPFFILFPGSRLAGVGSVRMDPVSQLVPASADPVVEIQDQQFHPGAGASFTGSLVNQSGQLVNVAHVLGTFYDRNGQLVWVADQYVDRALLPQQPVPFRMTVPADLAPSIASQRAVVATYTAAEGQG